MLENRIRLLLPLGLSSIWLKATGDHDFNMGRVLGFESHEWDLMLNLSGLLKNKRSSGANPEIPNLQSSTTSDPCKGFIKKFDNFDTSERLVSDIVKRYF